MVVVVEDVDVDVVIDVVVVVGFDGVDVDVWCC